jgi:hypothetical protein
MLAAIDSSREKIWMVVVLSIALSASPLSRQVGTGGILELPRRQTSLGDLVGFVVLHAVGGVAADAASIIASADRRA